MYTCRAHFRWGLLGPMFVWYLWKECVPMSACLHRYFSHKGFSCSRATQFGLYLLGCLASQVRHTCALRPATRARLSLGSAIITDRRHFPSPLVCSRRVRRCGGRACTESITRTATPKRTHTRPWRTVSSTRGWGGHTSPPAMGRSGGGTTRLTFRISSNSPSSPTGALPPPPPTTTTTHTHTLLC
jgi:hypothetical protein